MSGNNAAEAQIQVYLDNYRAEHGDSISVEEVGELVAALLKQVSPAEGLSGGDAEAELNEIVDNLTMVQHEILMMKPLTLSQKDMPEALAELNEIVKATESSASSIMDAADRLAVLGEEVDEETADQIADISTILFESTSFQDICGQRITKVRKLLDQMQEQMTSLAMTVGDDDLDVSDDQVEFDEAGFAVNEENLLHGPQREGQGNSQDDIDALLASFD